MGIKIKCRFCGGETDLWVSLVGRPGEYDCKCKSCGKNQTEYPKSRGLWVELSSILESVEK